MARLVRFKEKMSTVAITPTCKPAARCTWTDPERDEATENRTGYHSMYDSSCNPPTAD